MNSTKILSIYLYELILSIACEIVNQRRRNCDIACSLVSNCYCHDLDPIVIRQRKFCRTFRNLNFVFIHICKFVSLI